LFCVLDNKGILALVAFVPYVGYKNFCDFVLQTELFTVPGNHAKGMRNKYAGREAPAPVCGGGPVNFPNIYYHPVTADNIYQANTDGVLGKFQHT
jgi:hypothetical protein